MKKYIALVLALLMAVLLVGCTEKKEEAPQFDPAAKSEGVMTYEEYMAAAIDTEVTVECYVQDTQGWWDNSIVVYAQDPNGGYFFYNLSCSEEDSALLVPGTKIKVTGYKAEFDGEVEIIDGTFEIGEGTWIAEPVDATAWLGTDELIAHMNELVMFKGLTVEAIEFKNGEPGDDIYVTLSLNGASYNFCVEVYHNGPDTEVYQTVSALTAGDVVDIVAYNYWYQGPNAHIDSVTVAE